MKFAYYRELVFVIVGSAILAANLLFVMDAVPFLFPVINVIGGLIATAPPVWILYNRYRFSKEMEQQFILFIRDVSDSIKSGMTLPMALDHCSKRDYMTLTKRIKKLSAQVEWGIPFHDALVSFSKSTGSIPIRRAVATIIATYKIGGKISDTLDSVGKSLVTIDKIKKERSASVYSQIVTSYIIFFVFILILIIMQVFLIPSLIPAEGQEVMSLSEQNVEMPSPELFNQSFVMFIVIQGFFAGLATGKMAEGSIPAGLKHSIFLILMGYGIFSIAVTLF